MELYPGHHGTMVRSRLLTSWITVQPQEFGTIVRIIFFNINVDLKVFTNQRPTAAMLAALSSCDSCQCCHLLTGSGAMKLKVEWPWPLERKPQHARIHKTRSLQACEQGSCGCHLLYGVDRAVLSQYMVLVLPQLAGFHYVLLRRCQVTAGWSHLLLPQTWFQYVIVGCCQVAASRSDQLLVMPSPEQIIIWSHHVTTALGRHGCVWCHGSFCSTAAWGVQLGQC